jgi:hypothetical protein
MRIFTLLAIAAWCGVLSGLTFAEEPAAGGLNPQVEGVGGESKPSESPMSIFNEEIRRFKFQIEHTLVTNEVAQAFMVRYSNPENPDIIGAYADTNTNSLVVIGPPESEPAIRKSLATWMVETLEFVNPSLEVQKRQLQEERKTLLSEMAQIEVGMVDVAERKGEQAAKELQDRLDAFEKELLITERKIEIVNKYMKRLSEVQE